MSAEGESPPESAPELVIFVGLQGSGKSTYYAGHFSPTHLHVSKDAMPRSAKKDKLQTRMIEEALSVGRSVVVDNTSPIPAVRAPLVELARRHGARVVAIFFDCSVKTCVERNRQREQGRVPDAVIYITARKLKPPTVEEGFGEVHLVTT